jgi:hypothetical protein
MKLGPDIRVLALVGLADLFSTLILVQCFGFREANPILAWYLQLGVAPFAAAKTLTLAPALFVLEWHRAANPRFVGAATRAAILLYGATYVGGLVATHAPRL